MSDPSTTSLPPPPILPDPHRHQPHHHHLPLIHGGATTPTTTPTPAPSSLIREYRKGNWTIQETLILITAKRLDDERRMKTASSSGSTPHDPTRPGSAACSTTTTTRTSGELRWKWVENYCWSHGCLRSQNQCNDKWDNLLRDFKKVRDYESKLESSSSIDPSLPSYWTLNKQQRKEQNLPSNMVLEVYQAISEVLQRKHAQRDVIANPPLQAVPLVTSSLPLTHVTILQPPPPLPPPLLPPPPPPPPPQAPASSTTPAVLGNIQ